MQDIIIKIDAILPQTQCRQCGYEGCLPYAQAIASGAAPINRCPPGGEAGLQQLAELMQTPIIELDLSCGTTKPFRVAKVIEQHCIGCTLCIKACPVDAIIGSNKRMHTVIEELCTGCELCIAPCPVDCIDMVRTMPERDWTTLDAQRSRRLHQERTLRLEKIQTEKNTALAAKAIHSEQPTLSQRNDNEDKQSAIAAALARARAARRPAKNTP